MRASFKIRPVSLGLLCILAVAGPSAAAELTAENAGCLRGTWAAQTRDTKAASYGFQFDGRGRVWITLAPDAAYVPAGPKTPIVRDVETDSSSGRLFFSLPDTGRFYLQELITDDLLIIRADNTSFTGGRSAPQFYDTAFERTSMTFPCAGAGAAAAPAPSDDEYSALQALDGFGAIFIALGEPVLFPIERAKTCKAETGSDARASGCAVIGFVVSPFLVLRDALLGIGDIVTGGYFRLSRKSGVFDYLKDSGPKSSGA